MDIKGDVVLRSPPSQVWKALNDSEILGKCTPGCKRLEPLSDSEYKVVLELGVAAIKGTYHGQVVITDRIPDTSYRLKVTGEGLPGFLQGDGLLSLKPEGENTRLSYQVNAQAGGKIAGVGQRVMGGIAKMLIGRFFSNLEKELSNSAKQGGNGR